MTVAISIHVRKRAIYPLVFGLIVALSLFQVVVLRRDPRPPAWLAGMLFRLEVNPRAGRLSRWLDRRALRSQRRALFRVIYASGLRGDRALWEYCLCEDLRLHREIRALE